MCLIFHTQASLIRSESGRKGWYLVRTVTPWRVYSHASQAVPVRDFESAEQDSNCVPSTDSTEMRGSTRYDIFGQATSLPPRPDAPVNWRHTQDPSKVAFPLISNSRLRHGLPTGRDLTLLYDFSRKLRVLDRPDYWDDFSSILEADLFEYLSPVQLRTVFHFWLHKRVNPTQLDSFFSFVDLLIATQPSFDLLDYNKVLWYLTKDYAHNHAQRMVPLLWEKMEGSGIAPDRASYDLATTSFMLSRDYARAGLFAEKMVAFGYPPSDALVKAISNIPYLYIKEAFDVAPESQLRTFSILLGWHDGSQ